MKTEEQYPSTPLEKEAVRYVANDDLAMFADDDTRMIYEHYYIMGYENAVAAERERIKNKLRDDFKTLVEGSAYFESTITKIIDSL